MVEVTQPSWRDVITPIAARFNTAWLSGGEAVWNAEGSEAMAKLLTRMAEHLDNGDGYFIPLTTAQAQAAAQEQRIADALAWLRDHIKEVDDDNSYWGGPHKRAYLDAPAILKELTARAALGEQQ